MNISYNNRRIVHEKKPKVKPKKYKCNYYGIYAIRCDEANRIYIGQSTNLDGRLKHHKSTLVNGKHKNKLIQNDYNVFANDFVFEVLYHSQEGEDLLSLETQYIAKYESLGYESYNTIMETEVAFMISCSRKEHHEVLSRINELLKKGKITAAQLSSGIEYIESNL